MNKENIFTKLWKFKNTFLLLFSIIFIAFLIEIPAIQKLIYDIGEFRYLGVFLAGVFFVSTFTVVPAGIVLFFLAESLNPFYIAIVAGLGGVFGDYLIFRFLKDRVFEEIKPTATAVGFI